MENLYEKNTKNIRTCIFILKNVAYLKGKRPMGGLLAFVKAKHYRYIQLEEWIFREKAVPEVVKSN